MARHLWSKELSLIIINLGEDETFMLKPEERKYSNLGKLISHMEGKAQFILQEFPNLSYQKCDHMIEKDLDELP